MTNTRDGAATSEDLVAMLAATWTSLDGVLAGLNERQWKSPTQCPGWSVQDTVAHLIATERLLAGDPSTTHRATDLSHTRNPIGEWNEHEVDARRGLPGAEVLAEWRDVTRRRLDTLRAMQPADFDTPMNTPTGPGTLTSFLELRVMDSWVHEVDIRRALSLPLTSDEASALHALRRFARSMQIVVGKRVAPPDETIVRFRITGTPAYDFDIAVHGRRAELAPPATSPATVTLTMDSDVFAQLACGRTTWSVDDTTVLTSGDADLANRILAAMNVMI
jgi:uncharacterized protein (TIGR03083 family)